MGHNSNPLRYVWIRYIWQSAVQFLCAAVGSLTVEQATNICKDKWIFNARYGQDLAPYVHGLQPVFTAVPSKPRASNRPVQTQHNSAPIPPTPAKRPSFIELPEHMHKRKRIEHSGASMPGREAFPNVSAHYAPRELRPRVSRALRTLVFLPLRAGPPRRPPTLGRKPRQLSRCTRSTHRVQGAPLQPARYPSNTLSPEPRCQHYHHRPVTLLVLHATWTSTWTCVPHTALCGAGHVYAPGYSLD
ncbi:hypothetical protein OH76DRAFT_539394 [Lentinus brumalis]|uniref:Uncharacterized protein n=1 Tax=Lentinus brumalis TaxID=2498619 RepID=A0A371CHK1_9APHY|nr:hypothetical protein OH76DRAFT_539394 [Polyporus brumalis]